MTGSNEGGGYWRPVELIPADWTPNQALAVFTVIDQLRELIWQHYGQDIQDALRQEQGTALPASPDRDPAF